MTALKNYALIAVIFWKKKFILPFLSLKPEDIIRTISTSKILSYGLDNFSVFYVWGIGKSKEIENLAKEAKIPITRIEDGFIRSASLGSDITRPYSLVFDSRGIYFDPTTESDLEHILSTYEFNDDIRIRAEKITKIILESKLSKYNHQKHQEINILKTGYDKVVLIPGQVEDDASMILGGYGMTNEKLVLQARKSNPSAFIIFKPHPDVVAGNRKGKVSKDVLEKCCNIVIENNSIDSCISVSDEVHTITSLCGFDAILRDKKVVTYGMPFYAGWGLTEDKIKCERRIRRLTKYELIAGTLLLYPKYIDPKTNKLCEIETVLNRIEKEQKTISENSLYSLYNILRNNIYRMINKINIPKTN